ncbi:MAG TPA: hypothetical protein PKZ76_13440 [Xanthomonadaceae bacterium]|nr:hypothetical protein [Xanthomonadaceae bacterium]
MSTTLLDHAMRSRPMKMCLCLVTALLAAPGLPAQSSGGDFAITRQAIAGGGGESVGGAFAAGVTLGQYTVETQSGGSFDLRGGFHQPGPPLIPPDPVFSDGFEAR